MTSPADDTIKQRFDAERAAASARRGARVAEATAADGHAPVANPDVSSSPPSIAIGGDGGPTAVEKIAPAVPESQAAAGPPLDAYWASYGDPPTRALIRSGIADIAAETIHGVDDRTEITATSEYPWSAIASLNITAVDGSTWIGTAWFVSPRMLVTAGHVVYMQDHGGWASQIEVIPGRHGADPPPFGTAICTDYRSVSGWTVDRNASYDYGVLLLPDSARLGDRVGWFGYEARGDSDLQGQTVNLTGYPGDKPAGTMWYHSNVVTAVHPLTFDYEIDTFGGQSGAPVYMYFEGRGRYGVGIHTYGSVSGNSATRITSEVMTNLNAWRALVP